jgi:hypothetical protein
MYRNLVLGDGSRERSPFLLLAGTLRHTATPTRMRWLTSPSWHANMCGRLWKAGNQFRRGANPLPCRASFDPGKVGRAIIPVEVERGAAWPPPPDQMSA